MNFIKAQLARIQKQLGGLTASQKMLTATLVAVMLVTLLWWAKYAGDPEMKPVLDQTMSKEEMGTIEHALEARGIKTVVQGDRILVPADQLNEALAELSFSQALPTDTSTGFDDIVKQMTPWDTVSKQDKMWMEAKQRTLAGIIRHWKGVRWATVMIDTPDHRSFTEQSEATATVNISTGNGGAGAKLGQAAAELIAGATSGLKRSNVSVIIDSIPFQMPDKDGDQFVGNGEVIELRKAQEKDYEDKIRRLLSYISTGPVMVSVTVNVDTKTTQQQKHSPNLKEVVQAPTKTIEQHDDTTGPAQGQGEAGVGPNTGLSLGASGSGGGAGSSSGTDTSEYKVDNGYTDTVTRMPAGDATVIGAAINVPQSYFVELYKKRNPKATGDPDDAALQSIIAPELQKIRDTVKRCTGLGSDDAIAVAAYQEVAPPTAMAAEERTTSAAVVSVTDHAKEIAVGVLAVVSLFMVSSMARKSIPAPVIEIPEEPKEPTSLNPDDEVAGEVGSGENTLDGMELDEDSVKTQQMLDQVSTMVQENPDAAANLVKRWLNRQ